jgi:hypothetical protein
MEEEKNTTRTKCFPLNEPIEVFRTENEQIVITLREENLKIEIKRNFDSLVWKKSFTFDDFVELDTAWKLFQTLELIAENIQYSFAKDLASFVITEDNIGIIKIQFLFLNKGGELQIAIDPKDKSVENALSEHAEALRNLKITVAKQEITVKKLFRCDRDWSFTGENGVFHCCDDCAGELELKKSGIVRWDLGFGGIYTNSGTTAYKVFVRFEVKDENGQIQNWPNDLGYQVHQFGQNYCYSDTRYFTDIVELDPGMYTISLQVRYEAGSSYKITHSPDFGTIYCITTIY